MNDARNIPLEVDVWNAIEDELNTRLVDVFDLHFKFTSGDGARIKIRHPKDSQISTKTVELNQKEAVDLIISLANRFNFHWSNIAEMSFWLRPGEVPLFNVGIHPRVSDPSTLDNRKSRVNMLTID